jgi:hypothetical protein
VAVIICCLPLFGEIQNRGISNGKGSQAPSMKVYDFEFLKNDCRLFVPSGLQLDQLSAAQQKKALYRMFKKAIAARGSSRYLLKNPDPMAQD